jgi:hypothetical protein
MIEFILVEGPTDKDLIEHVIGSRVRVFTHSEIRKNEIVKLMKTWMNTGKGFLYLSDQDKTPCHPQKRLEVIRDYPLLETAFEHICIVCQMIESWYWAGASEKTLEKYWKNRPTDFERITKGTCDKGMKNAYKSTKWTKDVLSAFSIERARQRNKSFAHFCKVAGI